MERYSHRTNGKNLHLMRGGGGGGGGGGAGTFLMEHNPKSTRGVGGCFLKFSKSIMVLFLSQKKEGVPQNMIIKVHGTFSLPRSQDVRICNQLTVNYQK